MSERVLTPNEIDQLEAGDSEFAVLRALLRTVRAAWAERDQLQRLLRTANHYEHAQKETIEDARRWARAWKLCARTLHEEIRTRIRDERADSHLLAMQEAEIERLKALLDSQRVQEQP